MATVYYHVKTCMSGSRSGLTSMTHKEGSGSGCLLTFTTDEKIQKAQGDGNGKLASYDR